MRLGNLHLSSHWFHRALGNVSVRTRIVVLAPSPEEVPDSSLSHMFGVALRELGDARSAFCARGERLDVKAALELLDAGGSPTLLCGTAFAFVHLLDALARDATRLALPASVRAMETGGFKGRARERPREVLYAEIEERLGIPPARIPEWFPRLEEIATRCCFGTDWPSPGIPPVRENLEAIRALALSPAALEAILSTTALRLFPARA